MKLLIEESVLRQALEALGNARQKIQYMLNNGEWYSPEQVVDQADDAITALRTAIEQAENVEPVMEVLVDKDGYVDGSGWKLYGGMQPGWNKLYPAPAVPEDEIERLRAERDELYRMNLEQAKTINKLEELFGVNK